MNKNIRILLIFALLFVSKNFAQVSTSVIDVSNNNQQPPITNCGLIDFGTSTNNHLAFFYKLSQPYTQALPSQGV